MFENFRPVSFVFIFLVIAIWVYYRLVLSRKRKGRKKGGHGRELWQGLFAQRRQERIDGASTWEERRQRMQVTHPGWKVNDRYLKKTPPAGASDADDAGTDAEGSRADGSGGRRDGASGGIER
jgi:hypothetical protein